MTRRLRFSWGRLTTGLGVVVLLLGALCVFAAIQGTRPPAQPTANDRALRQVREQRGPGFDVRYAEAGRGRAVCGYAGQRRVPGHAEGGLAIGGHDAIAFVSRPNRILFSDDPLPVEFREMQQRFCPGFLVNPVEPVR